MCARRRCVQEFAKNFGPFPISAMAHSNSLFINHYHFFMRAVKHLTLELAAALEKAELLDPAVLKAYQTYSAEELGLATPGNKNQGPACVFGTVSSVFPCPASSVSSQLGHSTSTRMRSPPSVCPVDNVQTGGVQNLADPEKTVLKVEMGALVKGEPTVLSVEGAAFASFTIVLTEQMAFEGIGSLVSPVLPEGKQSEEVTCHVPSAVQSFCVPQVGHEEATVSSNLTRSVVLDRLGSLDSGKQPSHLWLTRQISCCQLSRWPFWLKLAAQTVQFPLFLYSDGEPACSYCPYSPICGRRGR